MTTLRSTFAQLALVSLISAGGCAQLRAANATPPLPMEGELTTTLQQAEREASAARFGVADRLLTDFAMAHPNTREAVETGYWRALFKLDPANQTATPRDALTLLDGYLTVSASIAHRGSAQSLRRAIAALDRPAPVAAAATAAPAAPAPRADAVSDKSRDEEVQRLKEELAKANAELERIKKRLSQPNP